MKDKKIIPLKSLLSDVFEVQPNKITMETTSQNLEEWDSISHVKLVVRLEKTLDEQLGAKEASEITSVKKILSLMNQFDAVPESPELQ